METIKKKALPQKFKPGQSGNPGGRPRGSRNKATALMQGVSSSISADDFSEIIGKLKAQALNGDTAAAKLILPRYKATLQPVRFDLDTSSPVAMCDSILGAVATGKLPADVGAHLTGMIADRLKVEELSEMREQLAALAEQMARLLENPRQ